VSAFDDLWKHFSPREREILVSATADEMLAPPDDLYARVPVELRAKFMAQVIRRIPAIPLPEGLNIETDPR
jgi:hypothetical protein